MAKADDYRSITESDITTVLAEDINFKGTIKFKSSLMIKGGFDGEIQADGLLFVGEKAKLKANIRTGTLVSRGSVEGNITAAKSVVLCESASHNGDISSPNLILESGAVFNGRSTMPGGAQRSADPAQSPQSQSNSASQS